MQRDHNVRALMNALGIGDWHATIITPYLFMTPATTDASMPPVMTLVGAIQETLVDMGATLQADGMMDTATVAALRQITGKDWPRMTWYQITQEVLFAREQGTTLARLAKPRPAEVLPAKGGLSGILPFDIPGGWATVALGIAGYLVYKNRRRLSLG